jgi:Protein of unknown function (DUF1592)/Protein of unknown function (DUF1588)/Protein of unknown function (DUF1595)/Protein of unknown function (DUF1585)/Protein of unknown function (DUF1587)
LTVSETGTQKGISRARPPGACAWLVAAAVACLLPLPARASETKSFVLSYFYPANYYGTDTCPAGLNPLPDVFFKRDLRILGLPAAEVNAMFDKDYKVQNGDPTTRWVEVVATRGNGRDNVYLHPTTVPDAHLKPAVGRFAYGFNLDGKGAASPDSYQDPESGERGINNQLFRTIGCIQAYKGYPPPQPPLEAEYRWDNSRPVMGAWLISLSGDDLSKDGDVTLRFETALDPVVVQDANAHIQSDMTYRVADRPASVNVLRARIRRGVIYTEPAHIRMQCNSYIQPVYDFLEARMRLRIKSDGNLEGVLGGYQPWYDLYWSHAKVGYIDERGFGVDAPALFYALRRNADAYPDPRTHRNTAISSAYMIEAVPAFIARLDEARTAHAGLATQAAERTDGASWLARIVAPAEPQAPAAAPLARRLTADQYRHVIVDVFGPAVKVEGRFEPGIRDHGLLALGTARVGVTATGMEQYDALANGIAQQVVGTEHRRTLVPCTPAADSTADDACAGQFLAKAGALLYRRPLSDEELRQEVAVAHAASTALKSFYDGLGMSLAGMLESPQFLFRTERLEPDPARSGAYRLDAYSRASQLSFFLWNSAPDAELMAVAASGRLDTASGLGDQVDRMLASPRLETGVRAFFADMLQFELFDTLAKDAKIYPKWTFKVSQDAQEQTLRTIVDLLLTRHGDYRDLFTTRTTFLTPVLASIYRVPLAQNVAPWQPYEFPAGDPRAGILAQASFVALHSHEGSSSPTLRGKALRELMLCEPVPAPPANVNLTGAQDTHDPHYRTMRERLTVHRTEPTCAGCHKLMDPIGLALENFDSDGEYRTRENGVTLDTSGELDGIPFTDAAGLGRAMHDNPATGACLVRRLYSYATGRTASRQDMPWIRYLERGFVADGYQVPELMRRIATSENLYRAAPATTEFVASAESIGETAR